MKHYQAQWRASHPDYFSSWWGINSDKAIVYRNNQIEKLGGEDAYREYLRQKSREKYAKYRAENPVTPREPRICSQEECENKHYGHGLCKTHYRQTDNYKQARSLFERTTGKPAKRMRRRTRRAREYSAEYDGWTELGVLERDNHTCQICFTEFLPEDTVHIDHIKALWAGGSNLFENVRATHAGCNISRTREQEEQGI